MKNTSVYFSISVMGDIGGKKLKAMTPDVNGVFNGIPIGVIGRPSRNKVIYEPTSFVKSMNDKDSLFYTKLTEGNLQGEYGHPEQKGPIQEQITRMYSIDPTKVSHAILGVETKDSSDGQYTLILGNIKPCGPYGKYLTESLIDPSRNTAFSLRSLTGKPVRKNGFLEKKVLNTITFDAVEGPGYGEASKRFASLEHAVDINELLKNRGVLEQIGLESTGLEELYDLAGAETIKLFGTTIARDNNILTVDGRKLSTFNTLFNR